MILYGTATLAICMLIGSIIGNLIGQLLGVDADIGGVGFAMVLLIFVSDWLRRKKLLPQPTEQGVLFWSAMYIPIVIAMASIQNVVGALESGPVAIVAGFAALIACIALVPVLSKIGPPSEPLPPANQEAEASAKEDGADEDSQDDLIDNKVK